MPEMTTENRKILDAYKGLRVADVRDGMDWCGMMHYGTIDTDIKPLYRTVAIGIARTVRYLPYQGPIPFLKGKEYTEWSAAYYRDIGTFPFLDDIEPGDFICLDESDLKVCVLGSNSALIGKQRGAVGWVTNGGVRDTDEVILEEIPFWAKYSIQPMMQGRIQFDAKDIPIAIGGVVIYPGDVVAGDGDGIVVVPRKIAFDVAKYAHQELGIDKKGRRTLYQEMGMKDDGTI
jgi:regulator of RNase E activity RraA